jgi:hypothetical protein
MDVARPHFEKPLSLEGRLREASSAVFDQTHVIFGGTGAVGGQTAIQLARFYEDIFRYMSHREDCLAQNIFPSIVVTGRSSSEVSAYKRRVRDLFSGYGLGKLKPLVTQRGVEPPPRLRGANGWMSDSGIRFLFHEFSADPSFKDTDVDRGGVDAMERVIRSLTSPFEDFLKLYRSTYGLPDDYRFASVTCGIPIPSVAAYRMQALETLCAAADVDDDRGILRLKELLLQQIAAGLGKVREQYADEVLIAHTTAVGGMYDLDINGDATIRLGFAHSSLGDLLTQKRHFAQVLSKAYGDHGIKTLVTAAAIGINDVHDDLEIPYSGGVRRALLAAGNIPYGEGGRKDGPVIRHFKNDGIRVFPFQSVLVGETSDEEIDFTSVTKGGNVIHTRGKILRGPAVVSGENGRFTVDNALALYHVMGVASEAELAVPLATTAMLGDDPIHPWFGNDGVCYYTETANASLVDALLRNFPALAAESTRPFSLKAYQDLGSSKHQAELHTLGLYGLLHRLETFSSDALSKDALRTTCSPRGKVERDKLVAHFENASSVLTIEDIAGLDPIATQERFAQLLHITKREYLCAFLDIDYELIRPGGEHNMNNRMLGDALRILVKEIRGYVDSIVSLGTPILYCDDGENKILLGPYVAPLDLAVTHRNSISRYVVAEAARIGVDRGVLFNWYVTNNGFVDLRQEGMVTTAKAASPDLQDQICRYSNLDDFRDGVGNISHGYFTSSGITAMVGRMQGLVEHLGRADLRYGTHMGWKALFANTGSGHVLIPGIVEAIRMHQEGLGKVTGTEVLQAPHGYHPRKPIKRQVSVV